MTYCSYCGSSGAALDLILRRNICQTCREVWLARRLRSDKEGPTWVDDLKPKETTVSAANLLPNIESLQSLLAATKASLDARVTEIHAAEQAEAELTERRKQELQPLVDLTLSCLKQFEGYRWKGPNGPRTGERTKLNSYPRYPLRKTDGGDIVAETKAYLSTWNITVASVNVIADKDGVRFVEDKSLEDVIRRFAEALKAGLVTH